jgi:hypothetical protein
MMRSALANAFGFVLLAASASAALACSCARNPSPDSILSSSTAVFTGVVQAVETVAPGQLITTFVVSEPFKGAARGTILNVYHPDSSAHPCGVSFTYGQSYTVAASLQRGALWTSLCSNLSALPDGQAGELVTRLRALRRR